MLYGDELLEKYKSSYQTEVSSENIVHFLTDSIEQLQQKKLMSMQNGKRPINRCISKKDITVLKITSLAPITIEKDENRTYSFVPKEDELPVDMNFYQTDVFKHLSMVGMVTNGQYYSYHNRYGESKKKFSSKLVLSSEDYVASDKQSMLEVSAEVSPVQLTEFERVFDQFVFEDAARKYLPTTVVAKDEDGKRIEVVTPSDKKAVDTVYYVDLNSLEELITPENVKEVVSFIKGEFLINKNGQFMLNKTLTEEASCKEWTDYIFLVNAIHFIYNEVFLYKKPQQEVSLNEKDLMKIQPNNNILAPAANKKDTLLKHRLVYLNNEEDLPQMTFMELFFSFMYLRNFNLVGTRTKKGKINGTSSSSGKVTFEIDMLLEVDKNKNIFMSEMTMMNPAETYYYSSYFKRYERLISYLENGLTKDVLLAENVHKIELSRFLNLNKLINSKQLLAEYFGDEKYYPNEEELDEMTVNAKTSNSENAKPMYRSILSKKSFSELNRYFDFVEKNIFNAIFRALDENSMNRKYILFQLKELKRYRYLINFKKYPLEKERDALIKNLEEATMSDYAEAKIFKKNAVLNEQQVIYAIGVIMSYFKKQMINPLAFEKQALVVENLEGLFRMVNDKQVHLASMPHYDKPKTQLLMQNIINNMDINKRHRLTSGEKFLFATGLFFREERVGNAVPNNEGIEDSAITTEEEKEKAAMSFGLNGGNEE